MQHIIAQWVDHLRQEHPDAVAVVLKGSHARGEATQWSDIDFDVLVSAPGTELYRTWIEPVNGRLVHISAAVESLSGWLADAEEPSSWSLGLPTTETTQLLWAASDELRLQLDRPFISHPAAEPEVEDTMEALGKIRSALARGDDVGVYRNANKLAKLIPTLLVPLNPRSPVSNSRTAIEAVCTMPNLPEGFASDWLVCMGYVDTRTPRSTAASAERMFTAVLAMLPADPEVVGDDIARLLADGRIRDYLDQR
jgi:hypothetical protein